MIKGNISSGVTILYALQWNCTRVPEDFFSKVRDQATRGEGKNWGQSMPPTRVVLSQTFEKKIRLAPKVMKLWKATPYSCIQKRILRFFG